MLTGVSACVLAGVLAHKTLPEGICNQVLRVRARSGKSAKIDFQKTLARLKVPAEGMVPHPAPFGAALGFA